MSVQLKGVLGKTCKCCGEPISHDNVFTKEGVAEVNISGLCEVCFDNSLFADFTMWKLNPFIKRLVKSTEGLVLAGGALRTFIDPNENIEDYDLFVLDTNIIQSLHETLVENGYKNVFKCPEGKLYTYKKGDIKVQIVNNRPYKGCEDLINSFDITACCAAWDGVNIFKHRRFVSDVLNKNIHINTVEYPKATLNRIIKYTTKGYKLTKGGNEKFIESVNEIVLDDLNSRFYID